MQIEVASAAPRSAVGARARHVGPLAVCGLTGLVLGLGFFRLGDKSIWLDEAASLVRARTESIWESLAAQSNMGLHTFLLHFWIRVFGESETAIRSLSVLFAALCVPAVYLVGRRLFDRHVGLVGAVLLTPNAFFLSWAQQARGYSLLVLLVTLSCYFFLGELEDPSWRNRIGYVASSAAALDTHYFAGFVILAQLLTLLVLRRRTAFSKTWLGVAASIGILGLPEVVFALRTGTKGIDWIPSPSVDLLRSAVRDLGGRGGISPLVLLSACGFAVVSAAYLRDRWREGFLFAWLAVPIALSFAVSYVQPVFVSRYILVSLPALVLLSARGLTRLRAPLLVAGIFAVVFASGYQLTTWYRAGSTADWRAVKRYVFASMRPGDAVLFYPDYARLPFQYYERRDGVAPFPPLLATLPQHEGNLRVWLMIRESDAARDPAALRTFEQALRLGYRSSGRRGFSGIQVVLYRWAA